MDEETDSEKARAAHGGEKGEPSGGPSAEKDKAHSRHRRIKRVRDVSTIKREGPVCGSRNVYGKDS